MGSGKGAGAAMYKNELAGDENVNEFLQMGIDKQNAYDTWYDETSAAVLAPEPKEGGVVLLGLLQQVKKGEIWNDKKIQGLSMIFEQFSTRAGEYYAEQDAKWLPLGGERDDEDPNMANQRAINVTRLLSEVYPHSREALISVCTNVLESGFDKGREQGYGQGLERGEKTGANAGFATGRSKGRVQGALFAVAASALLFVGYEFFKSNKVDATNKPKTEQAPKAAAATLKHQ